MKATQVSLRSLSALEPGNLGEPWGTMGNPWGPKIHGNGNHDGETWEAGKPGSHGKPERDEGKQISPIMAHFQHFSLVLNVN